MNDGAGSDDSTRELDELRAELTTLRARLEQRSRWVAVRVAVLRVAAAFAVMLAALCATGAVVGVWAANTALDTERWVETVAELPSDPAVAAAVAQYATDEIFTLVDVEDRLRDVLPPRAAFAAAPIAGQLYTYVRQTVEKVLRSDRFQRLWVEVNRRAHRAIVAIVRQQSQVVRADGQTVTIDLLPLINEALRELETRLPELFGRRLDLPDLTDGAVPADLRSRVQAAVGVRLPPNFAQFAIYDGGRLEAVQNAVVQLRRGLIALVTAAIGFLALALWVSPWRRRTVLQFGVWLVLAVIAVTGSLRAVRADVLSTVPAGTYRDGADAALTIIFDGLRERGNQLVVLGIVVAILCYLAGPGRVPVRLRAGSRAAAGWVAGTIRRLFVREHRDRALAWTGRHVDPLRVAGVVIAVVTSLLLSSWTGLLVVAVLLTVYEVVLTVLARRTRAAPAPL